MNRKLCLILTIIGLSVLLCGCKAKPSASDVSSPVQSVAASAKVNRIAQSKTKITVSEIDDTVQTRTVTVRLGSEVCDETIHKLLEASEKDSFRITRFEVQGICSDETVGMACDVRLTNTENYENLQQFIADNFHAKDAKISMIEILASDEKIETIQQIMNTEE